MEIISNVATRCVCLNLFHKQYGHSLCTPTEKKKHPAEAMRKMPSANDMKREICSKIYKREVPLEKEGKRRKKNMDITKMKTKQWNRLWSENSIKQMMRQDIEK